MSKISNEVSYLKGLIEGKELDSKSEEGKILSSMVVLDCDLADEVEELQDRLDEVEEFKENVLSVLAEADDIMSSMLGDFDEEEFDDFFQGLKVVHNDDDYDEDEEDDEYEVTCEKCGNKYIVSFDDFIDDNVVCPECGTVYNLADDIIQRLIEGDIEHD